VFVAVATVAPWWSAFDRVRSRSIAFDRVRARSSAFERNALRRPDDCGCVGRGTQDGTYLVTYRLTTAGEYQLRVMYAPRHHRAAPPPRRARRMCARTHACAHTHACTHARTRARMRGQVQRDRPPRLAVRLLPRPTAERDVLAALAPAPPCPLIAKPAPAGDTHHARHHATDTNATQRDATQHDAMQRDAMRCNAMRCNAMQRDAMQCNARRGEATRQVLGPVQRRARADADRPARARKGRRRRAPFAQRPMRAAAATAAEVGSNRPKWD
jgi:pentapeptide MXKDX repeat protein